jgi:hypothetical protein
MSNQRQGEKAQRPVDAVTRPRPHDGPPGPRASDQADGTAPTSGEEDGLDKRDAEGKTMEKEGEFAARHPSTDKRTPPVRSGGMDLPGMESEEKDA